MRGDLPKTAPPSRLSTGVMFLKSFMVLPTPALTLGPGVMLLVCVHLYHQEYRVYSGCLSVFVNSLRVGSMVWSPL